VTIALDALFAIALVILALALLTGTGASRFQNAQNTCILARQQHRLVGPLAKCVTWNTLHAEDDDR
jgi:hypothetical protein